MYAAEAANSAKLQEDMSRLKEMYDTKLQKLETRYKMRPTSDEGELSIFHGFVICVVSCNQNGFLLVVKDHLSYASPPSSFLGTVRRASDSESLPTLRLDKLSPLAKRCSGVYYVVLAEGFTWVSCGKDRHNGVQCSLSRKRAWGDDDPHNHGGKRILAEVSILWRNDHNSANCYWWRHW